MVEQGGGRPVGQKFCFVVSNDRNPLGVVACLFLAELAHLFFALLLPVRSSLQYPFGFPLGELLGRDSWNGLLRPLGQTGPEEKPLDLVECVRVIPHAVMGCCRERLKRLWMGLQPCTDPFRRVPLSRKLPLHSAFPDP